MKDLWNKNTEKEFFTEARKFASPEQLFYQADDGRYVAYWPKEYEGEKSTLQSRNSLIGNFTEKWSRDLIHDFASKNGYYAVQGAYCYEIGLPKNSSADVAICKTKEVNQKPENIVALFEVKMSVVWNWLLKNEGKNEELVCLGDFTTHKGNPGLLRSDSMLKAIGKSINIRVSSHKAAHIPIIVLGNTPITKNYYWKVDHLKKAGIIQGFWSVNSNPTDDKKINIKSTKKKSFYRFDSYGEFENALHTLLKEDLNFFSGMCGKKELGQIIEIANKEKDYEGKAEKFLSLLREDGE